MGTRIETRPVAEASVASSRHGATVAVTHRPWRRRFDQRWAPYVYVAPFFLVFLAFQLFPIAYTFFVSLHEWHILGGREAFVGLEHYATLFSDPRFVKSVANTFSILIIATVPQLLLALVLAQLLNDRLLKGRQVFRVSMLVPNITSTVAVAIIFESIFGLHYGLLNGLLEVVGLDRIGWQSNRLASHVAIATMVNWRWTGYNAIIYLAGLQSVPRDLYEAAAIDGASKVQQFFYVTVPMLRPVILFTVIISTIMGLQLFAEPLLFNPASGANGGAANQFLTMNLYLYDQAFRSFNFGYASAISWVIFLIVVATALVNVWLTRRIRSAD